MLWNNCDPRKREETRKNRISMTVIMRKTQAFGNCSSTVYLVSQVKHHERYAARGISCSCLICPHLWVSKASAAKAEETTLSIRMLFDGRRKDHDVEADSHAGCKRRVFFDCDVRQQKIRNESIVKGRKAKYRIAVSMKSKGNFVPNTMQCVVDTRKTPQPRSISRIE